MPPMDDFFLLQFLPERHTSKLLIEPKPVYLKNEYLTCIDHRGMLITQKYEGFKSKFSGDNPYNPIQGDSNVKKSSYKGKGKAKVIDDESNTSSSEQHPGNTLNEED